MTFKSILLDLFKFSTYLNRSFNSLEDFQSHLLSVFGDNIQVRARELHQLIGESVDLLVNSFGFHEYRNVYLSFNGGKDSIVVLHIYRLATAKFNETTNESFEPQCIYFNHFGNDEFPEIADFIRYIKRTYNIKLTVLECDWVDGIRLLHDSRGEDVLLSFVLGTRSTDERSGGLNVLEPSMVSGLRFNRILPILNWSYGDIWHFIRVFNVEYCKLYDLGYTSIGSMKDTTTNKYLLDGNKFLPAYALDNWSLERSNRK